MAGFIPGTGRKQSEVDDRKAKLAQQRALKSMGQQVEQQSIKGKRVSPGPSRSPAAKGKGLQSSQKSAGGTSKLSAGLEASKQIQSAVAGGSGETDTASGALGGAAQGAGLGMQLGGGAGAAIGGGVGAVLGIAKSRAARKKKMGEIEANKQRELGRIEQEKAQALSSGLSNLGAGLSGALQRNIIL